MAVAAVFYAHACSLADRDDLGTVAGFRIGRLGTSLFFLLGGFLAVSRTRTPGEALLRRLVRIYPAFWVATALFFTAAAVTAYKPFDAWQVVSQAAGTGLFTHPHSLVGVHTWFVSVLLLMYLVVYLADRTGGAAIPVAAAVLAGAHFWGGPEIPRALTVHGLLFLAAYAVGSLLRSRSLGFAGLAAFLAVVSVTEPAFRHGAVAAAMLAAACRWQRRCGPARWFAGYAYEWFLLHGLCLHAAIYAFGRDSGLFVLPAAVGSLAAAVVLREASHRLGRAGNALAVERKSGDDNTSIPIGAMVDTELDLPPLPDGPSPCSASSAAARRSVTEPPAATS